MSEVKRYDMCGFGGGLVESKEGAWYHFEDFDRVTAERDALQQRLTEADQREDDRASLEHRHRAEFEACQAAERRVEVLEGLLREALPSLDLAAGAFKSAKPVRNKVRAALNPTAEGANHE